MVELLCYEGTGLLPDHAHVCANTGEYLRRFTPRHHRVADILIGAESLDIQLPAGKVYDYMIAGDPDADEENPKTYYYFLSPVKQTRGAVFYRASVDWWATSVAQNAYIKSGVYTQGHDVIEYAYLYDREAAKRLHIEYPVAPVAGDITRVENLKFGKPRNYLLVANLIIVNEALVDGFTRPVLFVSEPITTENPTGKAVEFATNISRSHSYSYYDSVVETWFEYEIKAINEIYIIPSPLVPSVYSGDQYAAYTAKLKFVNESTAQHLEQNGWYVENDFNIFNTGNVIDRAESGEICAVRFGNFTESFDVPLAAPRVPDISLKSFIDSRGIFSLTVHFCGKTIDLTESLRLPANITTISETAQTRGIKTALSAVSGVLQVGAGVATGNAALAAMGTVGLVGGITSAAQDVRVNSAPVDGAALASLTHYFGGGEFAQVACAGWIYYKPTNSSAVESAFARLGYTTSYPVRNMSIVADPPSRIAGRPYPAVYRQFSDVVIAPSVDPRAREPLKDMLETGVYIHFDVSTFGEIVVPSYKTWVEDE